MLSFYLAFLYADRGYFDPDRILCMSQFLFDVEQKNRLEQKGVLRRFSITCYGHQKSVEEMKAEKSQKFKELKDKKGTRAYEEYFLSYKPGGISNNNHKKEKKERKMRKRKTKRATKEKFFDPYNSKSKTKKNK